MKLILAVVQGEDVDALMRALTEAKFRLTVVDSVGGFLRERNATILIGCDDARLDELWRVITATCHTRVDFISPYTPAMGPGDMYLSQPVEVQVGGATIWVLNVERFEPL
jgi:uncharacterized protein YaaQ